MRLYPAIDLKDGMCVRLVQGNYDDLTVYNADPVEVAKKWESLGAEYIHIVDLDGAKAGKSINDEVIKRITQSIQIPIQVGGGIRNMNDVASKLGLGVGRVILGSAAVKNRTFVREAVLKYGPDKIVIGVDAKNGQVAIEGWQEVTNVTAIEFAQQLKELGVSTIIYTDIAKDGMLQGPNIEETKRLIEETELDIIASGGVTTLEDLKHIQDIKAEGAIIGKALYTDRIKLDEAIKCFK